MKGSLTMNFSYQIATADAVLTDLKCVSRWHGLAKLASSQGWLIIKDRPGLGLGGAMIYCPTEVQIVDASSNFAELLDRSEPAAGEPSQAARPQRDEAHLLAAIVRDAIAGVSLPTSAAVMRLVDTLRRYPSARIDGPEPIDRPAGGSRPPKPNPGPREPLPFEPVNRAEALAINRAAALAVSRDVAGLALDALEIDRSIASMARHFGAGDHP